MMDDGGFTGGLILFGLIALYLLPCIIAATRHKRNQEAICALNFFFGWTGLGWGVALIWSLMAE